MSNKTKTHYRKAFNSPYLSSADIVGNTVLTVRCVTLESDKSKKSKDMFNTMYFQENELRRGEKLKPMILNAINSKTMRELTGSHYIDDWVNIKITIYVDPNVRFGRETVEGLRISPQPPAPAFYSDEDFETNYPKWKKAILTGSKNAESLVSTLIGRNLGFNPEQLKALNELKNIKDSE